MRSPLALLELALGWALRTGLRRSGRRAGLVLVYHGLAEEDGDEARELAPPLASRRFESHLGHLRACYRIVRLEELLAAVRERRRGEPFPVALTFDDDLASHLEVAAPLLQRAGAPATFFLCGASLERPYHFWWQRLPRALATGVRLPVTGRDLRELAAHIESLAAEERRRVETLLAEAVPELDERGLDAERVADLVAHGFDVGFHTLRHERLTSLDDHALAEALVAGREELERAAGRPLTAIAYPHGKADARVADAAREAGFRLGVTGRHEPVTPSSDPLLLGRIEATRGTDGRFALQLARTLTRARHA